VMPFLIVQKRIIKKIITINKGIAIMAL
jgi:hypothetical protein